MIKLKFTHFSGLNFEYLAIASFSCKHLTSDCSHGFALSKNTKTVENAEN